MKAVRDIFRVLSILLAVGTLVLFFFNFVDISFTGMADTLKLTGAEISFGTDVTAQMSSDAEMVTFKSGWYFLAFLAAAFTTLLTALGFKFKGAVATSLVTGLFGGITTLVVLLDNPIGYIDTGRLDALYTASSANISLLAYVAAAGFFATVIASAVGILVNDRMLVLASKGTRLSIFGKIIRFLKDYKAEIKKIVWPNVRTVVRNTVIVLVMCLIVGAFIWLVDWGLSEGMKAIFNSDSSTTSSSIDYDLTTSSGVSSVASEESVVSLVSSES